MPRIRLDEEEQRNILTSHNIRKYQDALQITDLMMAKELGISRTTWVGKRNHPERLTFGQFRQVVNRLKMPDAEVLEGIR